MFMQAPPLAAVLRGGPGSGHFGHEGREESRGHSPAISIRRGAGAESKKRVGITSSRPGKPNAQVFEEMPEVQDRLLALPTVANAEVEPGLGVGRMTAARLSGADVVVSYEGNGEAQALLEETAKQYEQDAVLVMGGTDGRTPYVPHRLRRQRDAGGARRHPDRRRQARLRRVDVYRDEQGHAVMELVTVPQWGGDVGSMS